MENEGYETDYLRRPFMYDSRHFYSRPLPDKKHRAKYRYIIGFVAFMLVGWILSLLNVGEIWIGVFATNAYWICQSIARDYRKWMKQF